MMRPSSGRRRRVLGVGLGLLVGATTAAPGVAVAADTSQEPKAAEAAVLTSHDYDLLAEAQAAGERRVTVLFATGTGKGVAANVAGSIEKLGGTVSRRFDRLGYVLASVPTNKVEGAARIKGVSAVDVDEVIELPDARQGLTGKQGASQTRALAAGPGEGTPDDNPYMPTNETGAVEFKEAHPTWDGRDVTIGIIDSGVDLDHPALQETSTGERKITDWVTATDPIFDGDLTWRPMLTTFNGPSFTAGGATWTAPAGEFKFSTFRETATAGSEIENDVNRDGDTTDVWGILYRPTDNAIWVDVDQDNDFTDEELMRPYGEDFQVGHFGTDDPGTEVVEQMPFVVEYREDVDMSPYGGQYVGTTADFVNIGIVADAHGSHVAGITAANSMFGGEMDGAAPGAKLVSSRACTFAGGCTAAALTTGMADLVVNRGVDVINMSIGGLPALNDGNNARATLYDRLIFDYGTQMFISAGNSGPGLNTIGDPSVAGDVISVAAGVSKDTWLANYGSVVRKEQNLFNFSSRGPREDGGIKPNITAPGSAISTVPQWIKQPDLPDAGYTLPIGYAMFNGTSMASPQAAGAAALLLSAGFANDKGFTPAQMRRALFSSATYRTDVPAYGQGTGWFNTTAAWNLMSAGISGTRYAVDAPVCTELSDFLATPDRGTGVYNRCDVAEGGQAVNVAKTYKVTVKRTTGPAGLRTHNLSWKGNDGTWSAGIGNIKIARNKPITLNLKALPKSQGAKGAILRLDDPFTRGIDFEFMNTVVAAATPKAPSWTSNWAGTVDRNSSQSYFVTVPEGAKALQMNLRGIASGSQTRMLAIDPYGVPAESTSSAVCFTHYSNARTCNPTSRSIANPMPGVWEIQVESRRTSPILENPYNLSVAIQGVQVTPEVVTLPSVTPGEPTDVEWTLQNQFAPVTVSGKGGPLGSAHSETGSISTNQAIEYTVTVPEGATAFTATIGNTSDPSADLDLSVYRGTTLVGQQADGDSEESVTLRNPAPGTYTVEVFGYEVPAGTTQFDYRDVFYSPELGTLTVDPTSVTLPAGGTGTISGQVVAESAPEEGRQLFGEMLVVSSENAVVGSGSVLIEQVGGPLVR